MNTSQVQQILSKHNISFKFEGNYISIGYHLWKSIKEKNDPLTEQEHIVLFDFFWKYGSMELKANASISNNLKIKLIRNRNKIRYDMVIVGHIEGSIIPSLIKNCNLNEIEEAELWNIFHKLWHHDSARDSDEINGILRTYKIIEHNLKWFGKINVLDIGCGKNGNGISTLAAKYYNKIKGFGIDLDIHNHPSNVTLIKASAERMPFKDNFFDVIYSCNVIYYFSNDKIADILKEILRVLKSKGYFVFDDNKRSWQKYRDKIIPRTLINAKVISKSPIIIVKY